MLKPKYVYLWFQGLYSKSNVQIYKIEKTNDGHMSLLFKYIIIYFYFTVPALKCWRCECKCSPCDASVEWTLNVFSRLLFQTNWSWFMTSHFDRVDFTELRCPLSAGLGILWFCESVWRDSLTLICKAMIILPKTSKQMMLSS